MIPRTPSAKLTAVLVTAVLAAGAAGVVSVHAAQGEPERVRLIGEQRIPYGHKYQDTTVGSLSGLDYDPASGQWYLISDDRSELQASRFYTADLDFTASSFEKVTLTGTRPLLRPDGSTFPPRDQQGAADPEAIRFHDGTLYWTSEGERQVPDDGGDPTLTDPFLRAADPSGEYRREARLPRHLRMSAQETGPRDNLTLEGLAVSADGGSLVTSMEGPLYQDGATPTTEHGATVRLTFTHRATGLSYRQVAYPVEPVFAESDPPGEAGENGVVDVLAVDRSRYLVMERAYVPGVGNRIRIFEVSLRGASNVLHRESLETGNYRPVRKKLLVDLADLPLDRVDNVEGMAWGPKLDTGERSLMLVSDDNFSDNQVTQLIALGVQL